MVMVFSSFTGNFRVRGILLLLQILVMWLCTLLKEQMQTI